jgi:aminoglycoside/choline kinase family phosphotransferase
MHAAEEFPEWVSGADLALHRRLVRDIPEWWSRLDALPKTLVHNDFNPRNIALRREGAGFRLVAYDWELATMHVPQHDLAELLAFVLTPGATADAVSHYLEIHRRALEAACGDTVDREGWRSGYALSLMDLAVNRFAQYAMVHTFRHYGFMARVIPTLRRLIALELGA